MNMDYMYISIYILISICCLFDVVLLFGYIGYLFDVIIGKLVCCLNCR